jgi:hypothetical protein
MASIISIRDAAATPSVDDIVVLLAEPLRALQEEVSAFRRQPPTAERTHAFEKKRPRFYARPVACLWSRSTTPSNRNIFKIVRCGCAARGRSIGGARRVATRSVPCSAPLNCGAICTRPRSLGSGRCFPWRYSWESRPAWRRRHWRNVWDYGRWSTSSNRCDSYFSRSTVSAGP